MTRYEDFQIDVRINSKIFARMFFFFILLIIRHHPCKSVLFVDDATLWFWLLLPCLREENSIHWIKLESGLLTSLHKNVWYFIDRIHCLPWEYRNWILFRCLLVSLTFLVSHSSHILVEGIWISFIIIYSFVEESFWENSLGEEALGFSTERIQEYFDIIFSIIR